MTRAALALALLALAGGVGEAQPWKTPAATPTFRVPTRPPTPAATSTPQPPQATVPPQNTPRPTTVPVRTDGVYYVGIWACLGPFWHRDFQTGETFVRFSDAEQWRVVRPGADVTRCWYYSNGFPVTAGDGPLQIRWQDGARFDERKDNSVCIKPLTVPVVPASRPSLFDHQLPGALWALADLRRFP